MKHHQPMNAEHNEMYYRNCLMVIIKYFSCNAELTTNNIKTSNQKETMFLLFQCILTVLIQRLRSESTGEGTDRHHPEAQGRSAFPFGIS
jgi:hypothetical protein